MLSGGGRFAAESPLLDCSVTLSVRKGGLVTLNDQLGVRLAICVCTLGSNCVETCV